MNAGKGRKSVVWHWGNHCEAMFPDAGPFQLMAVKGCCRTVRLKGRRRMIFPRLIWPSQHEWVGSEKTRGKVVACGRPVQAFFWRTRPNRLRSPCGHKQTPHGEAQRVLAGWQGVWDKFLLGACARFHFSADRRRRAEASDLLRMFDEMIFYPPS